MSIKIYYGLRAAIPTGGLWALADRYREVLGTAVTEISRDLAKSAALNIATKVKATDVAKMKDYRGEGTRGKIESKIFGEIFDLFNPIRRSELMSPAPSVTLLRYASAPDQYVLAMPFGWCVHQLIGPLRNVDGVEDWSFWDSSDPPDDVPEAEFEARWVHWKAALGGNGWAAPAANGLQVESPIDNMEICRTVMNDPEVISAINVAVDRIGLR